MKELTGKIPPQAVELEEAVLSQILTHANSIKRIKDVLRPEMFYNEQNRIIYEAALLLESEYQPIDLLTIVDRLRKNGKIDIVGGAAGIANITKKQMSPVNLEHHAMLIREKHINRMLIERSERQSQRVWTDIDIFEEIKQQQVELHQINELMTITKRPQTFGELLTESNREYHRRKTENFFSYKIDIGKFDRNVLFEKGDLVIISGASGMGKTAFALYMLKQFAKNNLKGIYFSLEMTARKLTDRMICMEAYVNNKEFRKGTLSETEEGKMKIVMNRMYDLPITIDDNANVNHSEIESRMFAEAEKGLDYVIIDHLQIMKYPGKDTRNNEIGDTTKHLKAIAKKYDIPVFVLSQLKRITDRADKRPTLSDLRDSGNIEQDADIVLMLYREDYYNKGDEPMTYKFNIYVQKYREGETGVIHLMTNDQINQFYEPLQVDNNGKPF